MTKKLSNGTKKASALSLREFYDQAPGQLPLESCLPSKPGDGHNRDSSEYLAHKLASASLHSNGAGAALTAGRYNGERAYIKPIAHDAPDYHAPGNGYGGGCAGPYGNGRAYANGGNGRAYGGIGNGERHAGAAAAGADGAAYYGGAQERLDDGSSYSRGRYAGQPDFDAPPKRHGIYNGSGAYPSGPAPPAAGNAAHPALFLPPPPPPPRPAAQQQQQLQKQVSVEAGMEHDVQTRRGSSALVDGSVSNGGVHGAMEALAHKRRLAGQGRESFMPAGAAEVGVGAAQVVADAGRGIGKQGVEKAQADTGVQTKDQAPAATAQEPAQQPEQQQPSAPPPPKNEFAARMAQAAAARMATRANSTTLLSGSPTAPSAPATAAAAAPPVAAAPAAKTAPVRPTLVLKQHLGFDTTARAPLPQPDAAPRPTAKSLFANGAGTSPDAHARPKLQLQPRSLPLAVAATPEPAVERWGSGSVGSDAHSDPSRPRIKLLPRGAAASGSPDGTNPAGGASAAAAADAGGAPAKRTGSGGGVFGAARPREQVLRERGVDPAAAFADSPRPEQRLTEAALGARGGHGSRGTSVTSADDDAWQTVGKHGRAGRGGSGAGSDAGLVGSYGEDPFALFGGRAAAAPTRFAVDIGAPHHNLHFARGNGSYNQAGSYGSYGSHGSPAGKACGGFGGRADGGAADEEADGIFRRALPVRGDLLL